MNRLAEHLERAVANGAAATSDFDLDDAKIKGKGTLLRPAGVLLAIEVHQSEPTILLTKRSSALRHHPGQIAFPGGKVDDGDVGPEGAALREAWEEVGLPQDLPHVIGALSPHETVTGFQVTPFVALLKRPFDVVPEQGEVSEVFRVPLHHVLELENFSIQSRRWRGQTRKYYTIPFGPYYIWGATARMLRHFAEKMALTK